MGEERRERRQERAAERLARLEALLQTLESGAEQRMGPLFQIIAQLEQEMDDSLPGARGTVESALADLGIEDDELPLGAGDKAHLLRLSLAISKELGRRLPLDRLLALVPGLPASLSEKGLLLPVAVGLASAYRAQTDPDVLTRRIARLRRKRARQQD